MLNAANQPSSTSVSAPASSAPSSAAGPIAQQLVQLQTQSASGQGAQNHHATPSSAPGVPSQSVQGVTKNASLSGKATRKTNRFSAKEVREWLNIVGVLLIPLLIGVYTIVNNNQQATLAQQNRQADVANQLDQQREAALKTYEDDISNLLLDRHLGDSSPGDEVRVVALAKTLQVLHLLDGPRNARAMQFLQDAHLIGLDPQTDQPYIIIDFTHAELSQDDLSEANLSGADLHRADLHRADLHGDNLSGDNLEGDNLSGADLSGADLSGADLHGAHLIKAHLNGASITQQQLDTVASLREATMPDGSTHP